MTSQMMRMTVPSLMKFLVLACCRGWAPATLVPRAKTGSNLLQVVRRRQDRNNAACGCGTFEAAAIGVRRRGPPEPRSGGEFLVPEDRFPVTWSGRTAVVAVPTELDLTIADGLRDVLLGVLNAGALGLVVDMPPTPFCASAGITAIPRAVRRAAATDAAVRLAVTSTPVLRVLELVGIDRLIDIHPDVDAALASLPDQARNVR